MIHEAVFPALVSSLTSIRHFVSQTAREYCQDGAFLYDLILAVDELVTNIIRYGYGQEPGKITIRIQPEDKGLVITLIDFAHPFDPTTAPEPRLDLPLEERGVGGLGIYLARELTDGMEYRRKSEGANELKIFKRFPQEKRIPQKGRLPLEGCS